MTERNFTFKNDDINNIIKEIRKLNKNLEVIILNLPEMDMNSLTENEKNILAKKPTSESIIAYAKKTYHVPKEFQEFDYSPEELIDILTPPEQMLIDDKLVITERFSDWVNVRNGMRNTSFQPREYANTIWFTGGCRIYGIGSEDECTIESYLQNMINQTDFKYIVKNCGQLYGGGGKKYLLFPRIKEVVKTKVQEGDILVIGGNFIPKRPPCHFVNSMQAFTKPYKYGEVFFEELPHLNKNGNRLVAECLFDFLNQKKILKAKKATKINVDEREEMEEAHPVLKDQQFMDQLEDFKKYLSAFKKDGVNGGICMNANPFTNGHRYLVETAASQCDHLYIFVAQENRTKFPFEDRWKMINAGVAHLPNVTVIKGGIFVGSVITFPEYYDREVKKEMKILPSLDLMLFADALAPTLGIKKRFVGTEPLCQVTDQYNKQLREILPSKGIELVVLDRKQIDEKVVSASYVRGILARWEAGKYEEGDLDHMKALVPVTTFNHIKEMFGDVFPKE